MSKAAACLTLSVALLFSVSACSGAGPAKSSPDPSGSTPTVAVDGAPPPTENTAAAEQPLPPQEGKPGISVASLPIGGNDAAGGPCVQVSWAGGDIPEGFGVEVSGVSFEPGVYRQSDNGCQGSPCVGYVFRGSERQCDLAITPTDASATARSDTEQVIVSMQGQALCPDDGAAACQEFADSARNQKSQMTVALPTTPGAPQGSSAPDGNTPPPDSTSPANSESPGG